MINLKVSQTDTLERKTRDLIFKIYTLMMRIKHSVEVSKRDSGNWNRMVKKKRREEHETCYEGICREWRTETEIVQLSSRRRHTR